MKAESVCSNSHFNSNNNALFEQTKTSSQLVIQIQEFTNDKKLKMSISSYRPELYSL